MPLALPCIWCMRESHDRDIEHIFPAALGCPDHLTLPGSVVCRKCNNELAHLDQIIAGDFDFLMVMLGIKRKRDRPAEIRSRGNVYAVSTAEGPNIFFNLDPVLYTTPTGQKIGPFRGRQRDVRPQIKRVKGNEVEVSFEVAFGRNPKFVRGLYKIALSSIAHLLGHSAALSDQFDWLREYVMNGGTRRRVMLTAASDSNFIVAAYPPWKAENGDQAMEIRIGTASFLLDLSQNESPLPRLIEVARTQYGEDKFSVLPNST